MNVLSRLTLVWVLIGCGAALPPRLCSQTILNVERLQPGDVVGWHASVEGAFSMSGGNSEFVDLTTGFVVGHRWQPHWLRLFTGIEYRSDDGERSTLNRFVHLRYGYELSPAWRTFHFAQLQHNHALLLRERALLGGGVRRTFYRTPRTQVDFGTGAMYEREVLDAEQVLPGDVVDARVWRMANLFVITRRFRENLRFIGVNYFQPELGRLDDFRSLTDLSFLIGLGPHVDLALRYEWRHDSRPPATLGHDDHLFETGIVVSLR